MPYITCDKRLRTVRLIRIHLSVQGVGLSSANYSEDVRSSETLGRYNLTRVRRQPVESGMEGASGVHKGACFYCKENGHWCRECPHKKHWNHDQVRRDGSYGQAGMNSERPELCPEILQDGPAGRRNNQEDL